jgi:ABC-type phosphate transport system substrate-binding protein
MADLAHPRLVGVIVVAIAVITVIWAAAVIYRWRRITWRNHMDTQLSSLSGEQRDSGPWAVWKVFTPHDEVAQPSLVLLRIRNSGFLNIGKADMRSPLTFTFPGRVVKEFTVTDCRRVNRQEIQPHGGSPGDPGNSESTIALPRFALKRRAGFKLLVMLSGAGRGVLVDGWLEHGRVLPESRLVGPVTRNVAFASVLLLLAGVQAGFTFNQSSALPSYCASGRLLLEGSTAFAPTAETISQHYMTDCPGASITVTANGTITGLNAVAAARRPTASAGSPATGVQEIAMSDGWVPNGYPKTLKDHPVAVIIFAVVVNKHIGSIYDLTASQLRGIFHGKITNWEGLKGGDHVPVTIVARTIASGTRRAFDAYVMLNRPELQASSYDCHKNLDLSGPSPVTKCEVGDTATLLERVNSIPGAIGYAQISDAATYPNVRPIYIDGVEAKQDYVLNGLYHFWTVEYLYTSGTPAVDSLAAGFLRYMDSMADNILAGDEYVPCYDDKGKLKPICPTGRA